VAFYGTSKRVPLSKTEFFISLDGLRPRGRDGQGPVGLRDRDLAGGGVILVVALSFASSCGDGGLIDYLVFLEVRRARCDVDGLAQKWS
jgi:hypothetical protein